MVILFILIHLFIENKKNKKIIKILVDYNKRNKIINNNNNQIIKIIKFKEKSFLNKIFNTEKDLKELKEELLKIKLIISDNKYKIDISHVEDENSNKTLFKFNSDIDKDLIGLKYPEIKFDKIKSNLINKNIISSLVEFMEQLEIKLIYLEKEINVTKLNSFYTRRKLYLKKMGVKYDDSNITELHNIVSWLVIHKSTQLKGIASDKYLACKYVQIKIGENICGQRIKVYNSIEEIEFKKILKLGNIILKVSNGCGDHVYIYKNNKEDIETIKQKLKKVFEKDYGLVMPEFFHSYSKKRIVLEKMFFPLTDLFEFKFILVNCKIKMIYIRTTIKGMIRVFYYDADFNFLFGEKNYSFDLSIFKKNLLDKLKKIAVKLSEDFPNFIRVDLYIFQEKIYLSELTFDAHDGLPFLRNTEIIKNAAKNWKRYD